MVTLSDSKPPSPTHGPMSRLIDNLSSYDTNVMLAAIISLLLVVLFVLLLHIYAKWFLAQAHHRSSSSNSSRRSSSLVLTSSPVRLPFHRHPAPAYDSNSDSLITAIPYSKGLEASVISSIPLFVYRAEECKTQGLMEECVICLSAFEENEAGRRLTKCGHGFHVECIDMWLHSHSSCPVCRAPAVGDHLGDDHVKSAEPEAVVLDEAVVVNVSHTENESAINVDVIHNSVSEARSSSSSSSSSSLGCSLKRMLSRNRSDRKVFPSSNVAELDA